MSLGVYYIPYLLWPFQLGYRPRRDIHFTFYHFDIFTVRCCAHLNFFVLNFSYLDPEVLLFILSSVIDVTDFCDSVDRIYLRLCWMAHFTESNINKRVHHLGDMGLEVNGCWRCLVSQRPIRELTQSPLTDLSLYIWPRSYFLPVRVAICCSSFFLS